MCLFCDKSYPPSHSLFCTCQRRFYESPIEWELNAPNVTDTGAFGGQVGTEVYDSFIPQDLNFDYETTNLVEHNVDTLTSNVGSSYPGMSQMPSSDLFLPLQFMGWPESDVVGLNSALSAPSTAEEWPELQENQALVPELWESIVEVDEVQTAILESPNPVEDNGKVSIPRINFASTRQVIPKYTE